MKFLKDLQLKGKKVLYRVDINSPIKEGKLLDETRIKATIPTIEHLLKEGAKQIIILAHQGREKTRSPESVLDLHAKCLSEFLGKPVVKLDDCRNADIPSDAQIVMLENVRLDDDDSEDPEKRGAFAKALAKLGEVYVNDAFGTCHRDHATISTLPRMMKEKAAGLLLQKEIEAMEPTLDGIIDHPFTIIIGGSKIETKLRLIRHFMEGANAFLLGGGVANTFLAAEGHDVAQSLFEKEMVPMAQEIALSLDQEHDRLFIPKDVIVADTVGESVETADIPVEDVEGDMKIFDIGSKTTKWYVEIIKRSKTIIWNGPLGVTEYAPFRKGSEAIARAIAETDCVSIIGGGETIAFINELGIPHEKFTHISTGGGAMLQYLSGGKMPGIVALEGI